MLVTWGILLPDNYLRAPPFRSSKIKEMYKVRKVKNFPCQSMWKMAFLWMENWNSRCFLLQIGLWIHKHQENSILNVTNTKPAVKLRFKRKKARTDKKVWRCNTILVELFEIGNRRLAQIACLPPSILRFPWPVPRTGCFLSSVWSLYYFPWNRFTQLYLETTLLDRLSSANEQPTLLFIFFIFSFLLKIQI